MADTILVDAGVLFRLANANTSSGGNLLNTLFDNNRNVIITDAVRLEATVATQYADAAVIDSWINNNSRRLIQVTTPEGAALASAIQARGGTLPPRSQYGDQSIQNYAPSLPNLGGRLIVASEDSRFVGPNGIPGVPTSGVITTTGILSEAIIYGSVSRQDALSGLNNLTTTAFSYLASDPSITDIVRGAGTVDIEDNVGNVFAKLEFNPSSQLGIAGDIIYTNVNPARIPGNGIVAVKIPPTSTVSIKQSNGPDNGTVTYTEPSNSQYFLNQNTNTLTVIPGKTTVLNPDGSADIYDDKGNIIDHYARNYPNQNSSDYANLANNDGAALDFVQSNSLNPDDSIQYVVFANPSDDPAKSSGYTELTIIKYDGMITSISAKSSKDGSGAYTQDTPLSPEDISALSPAGSIGGYIGSQLASLISSKSDIQNLSTSIIFSTVGQLLAKEIQAQILFGKDLSIINIEANFTDNVAGAIGGYAGGLVGAEIFKDLGIDPAIGRVIGGTIGAAVTLTAIAEVSQELGLELQLSTSLVDNLESGLPGAGVAIFEAATGLYPDVNAFNGSPQDTEIGSSVGGLIGTTIGSYFAGPVGSAVGTVIGQFLGSIIGSIFGEPSVGPNVAAMLSLNGNVQQDHKAFLATVGHDNKPSQTMIATMIGLGNSVAALLNAEIEVVAGGANNVGSSVAVSSSALVQIHLFINPETSKIDFYDSLNTAPDFPNVTARDFGNGSDGQNAYGNVLNDAVIRQLALTSIVGGDPKTASALQNSFLSYDATYAADALNGGGGVPETIGQLNYDLQAVSDYNLYQANKVAFLVGFAIREANSNQAAQTEAQATSQAFTPRDATADWNAEFGRGALLQRVWSFSRGQGALTIDNSSSTNAGNEGLLNFAAGIQPNDVILGRNGNDLILSIQGTAGDQITIANAFADIQHTLAQIQFRNADFSVSFYFGLELEAIFPPGFAGSISLGAIEVINDQSTRSEAHNNQITIVHSDGANLTLTGNANTVVQTGQAGTLTLTGDGAYVQLKDHATLALQGNQAYVVGAGSSYTATISGNNTFFQGNGNQGSVTISGASADVTLNGTQNQIVAMGDGETLQLNGDSGTLTARGNGNTLTANGPGSAISVGGSNSNVTSGNASVAVQDGASNLNVDGVANTVTIGSNTSVVVGGNQMAVTLSGAGNTLTVDGSSETLSISGGSTVTPNANTIISNGLSVTAAISGSNNNMTVNGVGNTVSITGNNDYLELNGTGGQITVAGASNTVNTAGSSVLITNNTTATVEGGGNNVNVKNNVSLILKADGQVLSVDGNGSLVSMSGSYGTAIIRGQHDNVYVFGSSNTVTLGGDNNAVVLSGLNARASVSGQSQFLTINGGIVSVADGSSLTFKGNLLDYSASNGNIVTLGTGVTFSETGGNNWVQASAGDIILLNGPGNGVGASGTGNRVTLTNSGEYASMSTGSLTLQDNAQATLTGDENTVTLGNGSVLTVAGSNNSITVTSTANLTAGGFGNVVKASQSTIFLNGPPAPDHTAPIFDIRGTSFSASYTGEYATPASATSLAALASTGANSVELVVTQFLADETSNTIASNGQTESDANLLKAIGQAQALGLQVLLKPHIDLDDKVWRALLTPSDPAQFFSNYKTFIVHYAQLAQSAGVPLFSVGCELWALTGPAYRDYWTNIIQAVRTVYSGQITYASASYETASVSFWDKVDLIGADAYERVTSIDNPTLSQLEAGWKSPLSNPNSIENFGGLSAVDFYQQISQQYGKQVLFTEFGYYAVNGSNHLQGDFTNLASNYEDFQQQSLAYQAFFDVFSQNKGSWLKGAYQWNWSPDPSQVAANDSDVQNKPSLNVLKAWYGPAPAVAASAANTVNGDSNSVTIGNGQNTGVNGSYNTISEGTNSFTSLSGNGNSVTGGANVGANLMGDSNTASFGYGSYVGVLSGNYNKINASNSGVSTLDHVGITVTGAGDQINVGFNSSVVAIGDYCNLNLGVNSTGGFYGSNSIISLNQGDGFSAFGSGNTIKFGADVHLYAFGTNGITDQISATGDGFGQTVIDGEGSGIFIEANTQVAITGDGNGIMGAQSATVAITGSNNVFLTGNVADTGGSSPVQSLVVNGTSNMVFLGGTQVSMTDNSTSLTAVLTAGGPGASNGMDAIQNFGASRGAVLDLIGGIGGYATASAALQAVVSDGHGGSMLALNAGSSIDLAGLVAGSLTVANFRIG